MDLDEKMIITNRCFSDSWKIYIDNIYQNWLIKNPEPKWRLFVFSDSLRKHYFALKFWKQDWKEVFDKEFIIFFDSLGKNND